MFSLCVLCVSVVLLLLVRVAEVAAGQVDEHVFQRRVPGGQGGQVVARLLEVPQQSGQRHVRLGHRQVVPALGEPGGRDRRHGQEVVGRRLLDALGQREIDDVLAAEPRCCPHCSAVVIDDARFCGMCGKGVPVGPPTALDAVTFAGAVQRFREAFDYIVVDAPSVLAGGDVNLIQDACEVVVLAAKSGRSEARELRRAVEQVAPAQVAAIALMDY